MKLTGKVAFINGGARIGITVAEELARKGCHLAISYRSSKDAALEAAAKAGKQGVKAHIYKGDMTVTSEIKNLLSKIKKTWGRLDILINMASTYEETELASLTEKKWDAIMQANLKSAFLTAQNATPLLRRTGGRIVNFSDWVAASGRPRYKNFLPYYTAKAGVIGLTQAQALELAPNILVNAIAPGPILPPKRITNEEVRNVKQVTPLGKWGGAIEIAKAVVFLCETDFVTGECLRVDGGRHLI